MERVFALILAANATLWPLAEAAADDLDEVAALERCEELDAAAVHTAVQLAEWDELDCYDRLYPDEVLEAQILGVLGSFEGETIFFGDEFLDADFGESALVGLAEANPETANVFGGDYHVEIRDDGEGQLELYEGDELVASSAASDPIRVAASTVQVVAGETASPDDGERAWAALATIGICWETDHPTDGTFTVTFEVDSFGDAHSASASGLDDGLGRCVADHFLGYDYAGERGASVEIEVEPAE